MAHLRVLRAEQSCVICGDGYKRRSEPGASGWDLSCKLAVQTKILIGLFDVMWVVLSVHTPGGGSG